ncbi:MAG: hypothetical protein ABL951_01910 [Alphaproteobacteria bacterium]
MQNMTLEQLRAAHQAGGVTGIILKAQGGGFFVEIATRNKSGILLAKARSTEPRRFGNPVSALLLLRNIGITAGAFDASQWNPDVKNVPQNKSGRSEAMRDAHKAAAYNRWLATEIQAAIDDPRPGIPHEDVMDEMDDAIAAIRAAPKKRLA